MKKFIILALVMSVMAVGAFANPFGEVVSQDNPFITQESTFTGSYSLGITGAAMGFINTNWPAIAGLVGLGIGLPWGIRLVKRLAR